MDQIKQEEVLENDHEIITKSERRLYWSIGQDEVSPNVLPHFSFLMTAKDSHHMTLAELQSRDDFSHRGVFPVSGRALLPLPSQVELDMVRLLRYKTASDEIAGEKFRSYYHFATRLSENGKQCFILMRSRISYAISTVPVIKRFTQLPDHALFTDNDPFSDRTFVEANSHIIFAPICPPFRVFPRAIAHVIDMITNRRYKIGRSANYRLLVFRTMVAKSYASSFLNERSPLRAAGFDYPRAGHLFWGICMMVSGLEIYGRIIIWMAILDSLGIHPGCEIIIGNDGQERKVFSNATRSHSLEDYLQCVKYFRASLVMSDVILDEIEGAFKSRIVLSKAFKQRSSDMIFKAIIEK